MGNTDLSQFILIVKGVESFFTPPQNKEDSRTFAIRQREFFFSIPIFPFLFPHTSDIFYLPLLYLGENTSRTDCKHHRYHT